MQIDLPNKTYTPVKKDRTSVQPPAAVRPVDQQQRERAQDRKRKPARPPKPDEGAEGSTFDDYA